MVREGTIDEALELISRIPEFREPYTRDEFERRLGNTASLVLVEEKDGKLRGFKCGYERDTKTETFYSWLGGVLPDYRRSAIASELLRAMEDWCRKNGYINLSFKTLNQHKSMLIFAIKNGFEIVNVMPKKDEASRIWLTKKL